MRKTPATAFVVDLNYNEKKELGQMASAKSLRLSSFLACSAVGLLTYATAVGGAVPTRTAPMGADGPVAGQLPQEAVPDGPFIDPIPPDVFVEGTSGGALLKCKNLQERPFSRPSEPTGKIDLTDVAAIGFDADLTVTDINDQDLSGAEGCVGASLLIDGVEVWSAQGAGTYLNQIVSLTGPVGPRDVDFQVAGFCEGGPINGHVCLQVLNLHVIRDYLRGDIDRDGEVGLNDLAAMLAAYGTTQGQRGFETRADLTGDGLVDFQDVAELLSMFGMAT